MTVKGIWLMKKRFVLHLDAVIVIGLLFLVSIGLSAFLYTQVDALTKENQKLQWQGVEDSFNLSSQKTYITKLKKQLNQLKQK